MLVAAANSGNLLPAATAMAYLWGRGGIKEIVRELFTRGGEFLEGFWKILLLRTIRDKNAVRSSSMKKRERERESIESGVA